MKAIAALVLTLATAACGGDETVVAYADAGTGVDRQWHLVALDGKPFAAQATVTFPGPKKISGQAPCNFYSGEMTAPYPWFEIGALAVTRRACKHLAEETQFFDALNEMAFSEVSGNVMILSNQAGREMLFKVRK